MNERLIEVAEEIAKRTEDHMLHKWAEIGGLAYLSSFHAAITILSQIKEFSPECVVSGEVDLSGLAPQTTDGIKPSSGSIAVDALKAAMKPYHDAVTSITDKPSPSFLSGDVNPRIRPGVNKPANAGEWREWQEEDFEAPPKFVVRITQCHEGFFEFGECYKIYNKHGDGFMIKTKVNGAAYITNHSLQRNFRPAV